MTSLVGRKRSFGVTIFGIIDIVFGVVWVMSPIYTFLISKSPVDIFPIIRTLIISSIYFFIGVGLLKLQPYSRILQLLWHGILLIFIAVAPTVTRIVIFKDEPEVLKDSLLNPYSLFLFFAVLYSLFVIYYFTRSSVKKQFQGP